MINSKIQINKPIKLIYSFSFYIYSGIGLRHLKLLT